MILEISVQQDQHGAYIEQATSKTAMQMFVFSSVADRDLFTRELYEKQRLKLHTVVVTNVDHSPPSRPVPKDQVLLSRICIGTILT